MKRLLVLGFLVSCCGTQSGVVTRSGGHYDADITDCYMHNVHHIDGGSHPRKICLDDNEDIINRLKDMHYLDRDYEYRIEKAETDIWIFAGLVPIIILERL